MSTMRSQIIRHLQNKKDRKSLYGLRLLAAYYSLLLFSSHMSGDLIVRGAV